MTRKTQTSSLVSTQGQPVALKSVHIDGRLDGLMLGIKVRQSYRNDTDKNLEAVWGAQPLWQSRLPRQLFDGETVHVFAQLATKPTAAPHLRWLSHQNHNIN